MPDRAPDGRFAPGNKVGLTGGRPPREREAWVMDVIRRATTEKDVEEVWASALKRAKEPFGYVRHQRLIFEYLYGKPAQVVDIKSRAPILDMLTALAAAQAVADAEQGDAE